MRIAVCGGVYSNPPALASFCRDARSRGAERLYCLGDLGGYGAEPEAVWSLLTDNDVTCIAGNYDVAIAGGNADCRCGYRDPRDQEFAQIMYEYTREHTSGSFAAWMGELPTERRENIAGHSVHMVHGSPLSLNDFWWKSLPAVAHRQRAAASGADVILATHSGLPWIQRIDDSLVVNVGVIGRPANDGRTTVCYALLELSGPRASASIVPLAYDWKTQARSMRAAGLPEAFVHTNETGWWATCLEILPVWERALGRYQVYDSSVPGLCQNLGLAHPWPDEAPGLPVRPLLGSPLFPRRIRVHPSAGSRTVAEHKQCSPAWELVPLGARKAVPKRREHVAQLTLSSAGWHWHPDDVDDGLLLHDLHTPQHPVGSSDLIGAVRSVNRRLLEHLEATGAVASPRYCAG